MNSETIQLLFGIGLVAAGVIYGIIFHRRTADVESHASTTDNRVKDLQTEISNLHQEASYQRGKYDATLDLVGKLQREMATREQRERDLAKMLVQARDKIAEMDRSHAAETASYKRQIDSLTTRIKALETERTKNRKEIDRLQGKSEPKGRKHKTATMPAAGVTA